MSKFKLKKFYGALMLFWSFNMLTAHGQTDTFPSWVDKDGLTHILKISPQRLFNFLHPGIELSYEVRTGKRFSGQLTAAYMYPRGYRVSFEEKLYFKKKAMFGFYISLGADYH